MKRLEPGEVVRFNQDGTEVIHTPPPPEGLKEAENDTQSGRG